MRSKLMTTIYFVIFFVTAQYAAAQQSPSYDTKVPPAYQWGNNNGIKAQQSGTPTKDDHTIINNISVTVDNVEEHLVSKTTRESITDVTEDILEAVISNNTGLTELAVLLKDASGTTSIFDKVNNIDGRLMYTPEGATESVDITELLVQTKKAIEDKAEIIDSRLIYTPEGATESVDITELVAKIDVTLNTVASQIIASMPSMSTVDAQINYIASEAEKLQVATLTSIISSINSNINDIDSQLVYKPNGASESFSLSQLAYDIKEQITTANSDNSAGISSITEAIGSITGAIREVNATDTVISKLNEVKEAVSSIDVNIPSIPNPDFNVTTQQVYYDNETDDDGNEETDDEPVTKPLSEFISEYFGTKFGYRHDDYYTLDRYNFPQIIWDMYWAMDDIMYNYFFCVPWNQYYEDGTNNYNSLSIGDALVSTGEIYMPIDGSYRSVTLTEALTSDKTGSPTLVLGRILDAVETIASGSNSDNALDIASVTDSLYHCGYTSISDETVATFPLANGLWYESKYNDRDMSIADIANAGLLKDNQFSGKSVYTILEESLETLNKYDDTVEHSVISELIDIASSTSYIATNMGTTSGGSGFDDTNLSSAISSLTSAIGIPNNYSTTLFTVMDSVSDSIDSLVSAIGTPYSNSLYDTLNSLSSTVYSLDTTLSSLITAINSMSSGSSGSSITSSDITSAINESIASDTNIVVHSILSQISPCRTIHMHKVTVPANTATMCDDMTIDWQNSSLPRKFIELKAANDNDVFYVGFYTYGYNASNASLTSEQTNISNLRPCRGRYYAELGEYQRVYVMSTDNISIIVSEGR